MSTRSPLSFISHIWKHKRWELFIVLAVITLILLAIFDKDKNTTYQGLPDPVKKSRLPGGTSKPEIICKEITENYFKVPFKKVRPDFLKYDKTGKNLELDMYNPLLNLAVEYNGRQHRVFTPYFHKCEKDFIDQLARDKFKKEKCENLGIRLIVVPDTVSHKNIKAFLEDEFKRLGM